MPEPKGPFVYLVNGLKKRREPILVEKSEGKGRERTRSTSRTRGMRDRNPVPRYL